MGTYYVKPDGISQKDLVNMLKDIETALGGTNSTDAVVIRATPVTSYSTSVATRIDAAPGVIASVMTAGSTMASGLSVAVSAGYAGGLLSLLTRIDSRLTSHSV